jgi:hypothetical protein
LDLIIVATELVHKSGSMACQLDEYVGLALVVISGYKVSI